MPSKKSRRLIVGCDGTWNDPEDENKKTNVARFIEAVASMRGQQRVHYESGVGARQWEAVGGGVYGYGLDKRILGAYRFLRKRFADRDWDRSQNKVFLVGFSRGAYTARRLSGLIEHSGIPVKSTDTELGWELYKKRDTAGAREAREEGRFFDIKVEAICLWDTVKATNDADYGDKRLCSNVVAGYHALAVDERRAAFSPLKWNRNPRVLQVWFAGVHSDVGGGYSEHGLSDIPLRWMIDRCLKHGLRFKANYVKKNIRPRSRGSIHDSFRGIWKVLGQRRRRIPAKDLFHKSVETRLGAVAGYRPSNLPSPTMYWRA